MMAVLVLYKWHRKRRNAFPHHRLTSSSMYSRIDTIVVRFTCRNEKQNKTPPLSQPNPLSVRPSRACLAKRAAFSIQIDPDEKGFFPSHRVINRVGAAAGSVKQIGREHPEDVGRGLAIPVQYSGNVCICVAFRHGVVSLSVRGSAGVESVSGSHMILRCSGWGESVSQCMRGQVRVLYESRLFLCLLLTESRLFCVLV